MRCVALVSRKVPLESYLTLSPPNAHALHLTITYFFSHPHVGIRGAFLRRAQQSKDRSHARKAVGLDTLRHFARRLGFFNKEEQEAGSGLDASHSWMNWGDYRRGLNGLSAANMKQPRKSRDPSLWTTLLQIQQCQAQRTEHLRSRPSEIVVCPHHQVEVVFQ